MLARKAKSFVAQTDADNRPFVMQNDAISCKGMTTHSHDLELSISFGHMFLVFSCLTFAIFSSNGSANPTCPTTPFSKNVNGRTPAERVLVRHSPNLTEALTFCAVNDLVRNNEISRLNFLLQATHCAECNHSPDTNTSQRCNICSRRHLVRGYFMISAMTGEERDWDIVVL